MNRNESTPAVVLFYVGCFLAVIGGLTGIGIGFFLNIGEAGYPFTDDPHPLRWVIGGPIAVLSIVFGLILVGISEIIAAICEKSYDQKSLTKDLLRELRESNNKSA